MNSTPPTDDRSIEWQLRDMNEARTVRRYDMESHSRLMSEIRRHER